MEKNAYRRLPKMDRLLETPCILEAAEGLSRPFVHSVLQKSLDRLREELKNGGELPGEAELTELLVSEVRSARGWKLSPVVNVTGVVLHTNLGRAPLGDTIAEHIAQTACGYSTLEYDVEEGTRGSRYAVVEEQLCRLTGAEAAMVVNNNAAAVFLMLQTLACGKSVAVSRGELVEIGGAFRVPEIMRASGALLHEVGTTNKTHLSDYENAFADAEIGALLKVHTSNFKIVGFSEDVSIEELSALAERHDVPLLYDLGAGFLIRPEILGIHDGVYIPDAVRHASVCCFSGDKLFGAGQAGILLGKAELIEKMKRNQLARMLRVDKMTLASIEAVLRLYEDPVLAKERIPVLRMLSADPKMLQTTAEALSERLAKVCPSCTFTVIPCDDEPGGGSLPAVELSGWAVAVSCDKLSANKLEAALRRIPVPVIGRISRDRLLLSVRTLLAGDEDRLTDAFAALEETL